LQKSSRPGLSVRPWNILVLSALLDPSGAWVAILFAQLSAFSVAHHAALRGYIQSGTSPPESATTDINHGYIAIKLWLMLAQKKSSRDDMGNITALTVWNELWPPFENLMNVFEVESRAGLSMVS